MKTQPGISNGIPMVAANGVAMTNSPILTDLIETRNCRYGLVSYFKSDLVVGLSLREYGEWAQREINFLLKFIKPGDTVVDAGAFVGTHTLAFAYRVGKSGIVYAFEPQPLTFEVLNLNVIQNALPNVKLFNVALSKQESTIHVRDKSSSIVDNPGAFSPESMGTDENSQLTSSGIPVQMMRLDQYHLENCRLIKIDVEGMELNILEGSRDLLRSSRPLVYTECLSVEDGARIIYFMRDEGYDAYFCNELAYNPNNYRRNVKDHFQLSRETSIIFVPREDIFEFRKRSRKFNELIHVMTLDDLVLGMLKKPQYKSEVLAKTQAADIIGLEFWANEPELEQLRRQFAEQQQTYLTRSRARHDGLAHTVSAGASKSLPGLEYTPPSELCEGFAELFVPTSEGHNQEASHRDRVLPGQWMKLVLPAEAIDQDARVPLRFDPIDQPGMIEIAGLQVRSDLDGSIVWQAIKAQDFDSLVVQGTAVRLPDPHLLQIFSFGCDPQICLPQIPELSTLGPLRFEAWIRFKPELKDLAGVVNRIGLELHETVTALKIAESEKGKQQAELVELRDTLDKTELGLALLQSAVAERDGDIGRLIDEVLEHREKIFSLERVLENKTAERVNLEVEIAQKSGLIALLEKDVAQKGKGIKALGETLAERNETLAWMLNSISWRITAPLRRLAWLKSSPVWGPLKWTYWTVTFQVFRRLRQRSGKSMNAGSETKRGNGSSGFGDSTDALNNQRNQDQGL